MARRLVLAAALAAAVQWCAQARAAGGDGGACALDLVRASAPEAAEGVLVLRGSCARGAGGACRWELPEGDKALRMREGEQLLLACAGKGNRFAGGAGGAGEEAVLQATVGGCQGAGRPPQLQVAGRSLALDALACARVSKGEVRDTGRACGPRNASLLEVGFAVGGWHPLLQVCHSAARSESLFALHALQGEWAGRRRGGARPSFEVGGDFYRGFSPNVAYQNANKTLQAALGAFPNGPGASQPPGAIDRGHLAPDADFLLGPYRASTYFYINTVPMWRAVNTGNWLLLENMLRRHAKSNALDLEIATGVYRVLELKDKNGEDSEVFLYMAGNKKQIPIPKYIWKVAYDKERKRGIAFVVINDPFKKTVHPSDILCPNICDQSGWGRKDKRWEVVSKGYLFCCEIKELKKFVSYIPKYDVKSTMTGSR